jgi:PAS domain S-box-containing protein
VPRSSVSLVPDRKDADELFQLAVESSPCGMVLVDVEGRIVLVNAEAERLFGYPRAELVGQSIEILVPERYRAGHPAARGLFNTQPERRSMGSGRELFGLHKEGHEVPVEIGLNPLATARGPLVLVSIVDITERKVAAQRLDAYARMLERSNEELQHFAYVVSHDLKAPLRGIASVAEWLAEDFGAVVNEDARRSVELMLGRVERLTRLIDGILQYSRVGEAELHRVEVDSGALVADVVASLAVPAGIAVAVAPDLPRVVYDETQLRQVFQNLIANALQHMGRERGSVVVACRREGDEWLFTIKDDGVGIAPRHHQQVFKLFERPGRERAPGHGVGLPIAKRIVERNGGRIGLAPPDEAGCEVYFTVPIELKRYASGESAENP